MADNVTFQPTVATPPTGTVVSTEEVTTLNGGAVSAQQMQRVGIAIRTGDGVAIDLAGDNANGLDVDVTRMIPGTGATNLGKAEDAAHTSGDTGVMALGVRKDADGAFGADGDYSPLQFDDNGFLKVNIKAGAGSGGTSMTDDAAFTPGSTGINPMGAFFDDVAPDSVNEGDAGAVRMSGNRNLYIQIRDGAGNERGLAIDANGGLAIGSVIPGTGATNLGKVEDAAHTSGDVGVMALAVRKDADGAFGADGDYSPLQLDDNGFLKVNIKAGAGSGGTSMVDDAAFTPGTTSITPFGAMFDDVAPDSVNEGDGGVVRMSANRNLYVTIRDSAGNERGLAIDANGALAIGSVIPGTGATNLGKAEDAAHTSGDTGVMALAVRQDSDAAFGADGDYSPLQLNATGFLKVSSQGNIAHDGVDAGNPVKIGAKAIAHGTNPTAVAAADRTDLYANRHGIPFILGGHPNIITLRTNYTAAQTDAALITVGSGVKIVVTRVSVLADNANTVDVQARIGFGTANTPTGAGVVLSHPGIAPGSGVVEGSGAGIIGVGADNEDLRITSEVPTTGSIDVMVSYFTIES